MSLRNFINKVIRRDRFVFSCSFLSDNLTVEEIESRAKEVLLNSLKDFIIRKDLIKTNTKKKSLGVECTAKIEFTKIN